MSKIRYILFVDDDLERTSPMVDFLLMEGYIPILAPTIDEAIRVFKDKQKMIDCIILDILMPYGSYGREETNYGRRTGVIFLKEIRAISETIPVIILTGYRDNEIAEEVKQYGVSAYLIKPCRPSELIETINKL